MNKRKVCALGMAFVLAGCSAGGSGSGKEQTLTVGLFTEMNGDFSPMYYQTVNDHNVVNLVYQGLLAYDKDANLVPELAEDLPTISDDGTTMTFKLKKGVKFSDGSKFTSKDVKATFSVMADPSYTGRFSSNVDFLNGYSEYHDGDAKDVSGIETPDDYTGWVHRMVITPMSKERYNEWNRAEKIVVTAHYGFTYEKPDEKSQTVSDVVAGNRLKWEGSKGHFYKVSYPDGRQAYISKSISQPETKWRASLKQDVESIIETAYTMIGIPYLWAGTSSKGVDCSGLVRTVLFMHDIIIPRDASQQAYVGERIEITSDFANVQRGDLVFFGRKAFSGRKEGISHVGIYLGNKQFIHALGDVHISSFEPADKNYDEFNTGRLLFAVRFLPYINKEKGMNTTEHNPHYLPQ